MLRRRLHLGAIAAFCALLVPPLAAAAPSRADREAARTILVRFKPSVSPARRAALLAQAGARPVRTLPRIGFVAARVDPSRRAAALALLRSSGTTEVAQASHVVRALDTIPTDPGYTTTNPQLANYPWSWANIRLPRAWDYETGNAAVTIAVIDTGLAPGQADLAGRIVGGWNFIAGNAVPTDDHGHGTMVATTAAGAMSNGSGAVGACPGCSIMPIKVLDANGSGTDANVALGIGWAVSHGADIINLSLGGGFNDATMQAAVDNATASGVLVVAAAGNSASSQPEYPGAFNGVVSVGASDPNDNLFGFSQFGPWVDLAAPGCVNAGDMSNAVSLNVCGTSFASPLVAGIAGLALSSNPALTEPQLKSLLETSAMVTGADVRNGLVDAANVLGDPLAPASFVHPYVIGAAQSGQTLNAVVAHWIGSAPLAVAYQWSRCLANGTGCVAIGGATGTTYTLTDADIGSKIQFADTATNPAGASTQAAPLSEVVVSAFAPPPAPAQPPASVPGIPPASSNGGTSAPTTLPPSLVVAPSLPPQSPSIVGNPAPGERLSADPGSLDDTLGVNVGFVWQALRSGTWRAIPRANDQDFDVPTSLAGLKVRVLVTTRNDAGAVLEQSASDAVTIKAPKTVKKLKLKLKR